MYDSHKIIAIYREDIWDIQAFYKIDCQNMHSGVQRAKLTGSVTNEQVLCGHGPCLHVYPVSNYPLGDT